MNKIIEIKQNKLKTAAIEYAQMRWFVLPLHWIESGKCSCGKDCGANAGKHPFGKLVPNGQENATIDVDTVKSWWTEYPKCNIGIVLAKSGLCAVDIDPRNGGHETIELLEDKYGAFFSEVMAFTGGGGEHRVFTIPSDLASLPGTLGAGVDLKYNGYIVVDPSVHISGTEYSWEGSSDPRDFNSPSPLPDWIRDLANRSNHDKNTAIESGFISRLLTDNQITDLRSALTAIDADDRDTWIRVGNALKSCGAAGWNLFLEYSQRSAKFNIGDQRRVWHSFKPHSLNYETVFHMAQEAGWVNMPTDVEPIISIELFKPKAPLASTLPELPGVLGEIERYYNDTAHIPQPAFAKQAALAIVSTILGRRFRTTYNHYSSLYFACIAPSACGKEHVKTVATDVFAAIKKNLLSGDGYTSAGGIFSALKEKPCHLSIIDEFGLYLEATNNPNNSNGRQANTLLMECISRVKNEIRSKNYSIKGVSGKTVSDVILRPAISVVGLTTPSTFYKNLSIAMIADGFFGRFLTVKSDLARVAPRQVKSVEVPQSIIDWSDAIDSRIIDPGFTFLSPDQIGDQCVLDVDNDAIAKFHDFSVEMVELMNELELEGIEALTGRSAEFSGRLAFIIALSANPMATSITGDDACIAINYVRKLTLDSVADVRKNLFGSAYGRAKGEILDAIRVATNRIRQRGVTQRDMHRISPFKNYKEKELAEILQALVKAEQIALVNTREGKAGKARMAFIAIESNEACELD